jgi:acetyl esterase/lipase
VWYNPDATDSPKPIGEQAWSYYRSKLNISTAIYFHGGNFIVGHKDLLAPGYVAKLLSLGFGAVVSPNYRLSPTITAYEGAVLDSKDAYTWARTKLPEQLSVETGVKLDADRIVAFGHSAGGTLALLMVPLTPSAGLGMSIDT